MAGGFVHDVNPGLSFCHCCKGSDFSRNAHNFLIAIASLIMMPYPRLQPFILSAQGRLRLGNARKINFSCYCARLALPLQAKKLLISRTGQVPRLKTFNDLI
jgi:hypothetical protein